MKVMRKNDFIASSDSESQQDLTIKLLHVGTPDEVNSEDFKHGTINEPGPMATDKGMEGS